MTTNTIQAMLIDPKAQDFKAVDLPNENLSDFADATRALLGGERVKRPAMAMMPETEFPNNEGIRYLLLGDYYAGDHEDNYTMRYSWRSAETGPNEQNSDGMTMIGNMLLIAVKDQPVGETLEPANLVDISLTPRDLIPHFEWTGQNEPVEMPDEIA